MDVALWRMPLVARLQESAFETDGRLLWFDAARVIDLYRKNPNEVLRGYFHTIMHCVFRHPFDDKHPERALWDIACDASVEATAIELLGTGFPSAQDVAAKRMLGKIRENCPTLTAQSIYRALIGTGEEDPPAFSCSFAASLENVFARDGHEAWPRTSERGSSMKSAGDKLALMPSDGTDKLNGKPDDDADSEDKSRSARSQHARNGGAIVEQQRGARGHRGPRCGSSTWSPPRKPRQPSNRWTAYPTPDFSDTSWQDISSQIDMDMEAFSGKIGLNVGTFQVNLTVANRNRDDYRAFLKRFSALSEEMKTEPRRVRLYLLHVRAFAIQEHAAHRAA